MSTVLVSRVKKFYRFVHNNMNTVNATDYTLKMISIINVTCFYHNFKNPWPRIEQNIISFVWYVYKCL